MSGGDGFEFEIPLAPAGQADGRAKMAEPTDPLVPTAVSFSTPGYDGLAAMGRTFVEEFALMGWPRERIARMFTVSTFAATYAVYQARGADFVDELITEVLGAPDGEAS